MSTYEVVLTFYVDDIETTDFDVETVARELIVEAERRPGWNVELERVDVIVED